MTSQRVLIVEDEWLIAQDYANVLKRAGHTVVGPVARSSAALVLVETEPIDVAVLDFQLGGQTSGSLADQLRRLGIPFAVISGHHPRDLPAEFVSALLLPKPVSPDSLLAVIHKLTE